MATAKKKAPAREKRKLVDDPKRWRELRAATLRECRRRMVQLRSGWRKRDEAYLHWSLDGDPAEARDREIRRALARLGELVGDKPPAWLVACGWTWGLSTEARACAATPPLEPDEIMARRSRLVADAADQNRTVLAALSLLSGNEPDWRRLIINGRGTPAEAIEAEARHIDKARRRLGIPTRTPKPGG